MTRRKAVIGGLCGLFLFGAAAFLYVSASAQTDDLDVLKVIPENYKLIIDNPFVRVLEARDRVGGVAWTVRKGATAPQAAGVIHTDFERGFIRAEVASYDDFVAHGGELGAKEAGKLRLEGRDYTVRDGDVIHFRFNV